jgi:glycosyltransferase involved in cell wall biosynthesis
MRVLHVITGLNQGGAETVLFRLIMSNPDTEHRIISLTSIGFFGNKLLRNNFQVRALNMHEGFFATLGGLFELYSSIKNNKPDVIQTWMYHSDLIGGIIAKICGCKKIFWGIHNYNLSYEAIGFKTKFIAKICSVLSNVVPTKIISCSEASILSHVNIGYNVRKFIKISLGYDSQEFYFDKIERNVFREKYDIPSNIILLGCIARWDPQKDHKTLIRAIEILEEKQYRVPFLVLLIGPYMTYENSELCDLISQCKNKVMLLGAFENIRNAFNAIDIHILSSLGESFPNVVAESMACGTPNIVTDVGDAAFIVGETGWIVPPSNPYLFSNSIGNAIDDFGNSSKWEERRRNSRKRIVENFSLEKMVAQYNNLWAI